MSESLNDKNFSFYNTIGVDPFVDLSVVGGFNTFKDLELIKPFIKSSDTIVELGAGYGRCLDYYIDVQKHPGKIIAIEQSPPLFAHLTKKYKTKVELHQSDLKTMEMPVSIDAALWMWSGILDFSKEEQELVVSRIYKCLNETGRLIIDVPKLGYKTIAEHFDQQHIKLHSPYGDMLCYIPSRADIDHYTQAAGFKKVEEIHYETATLKERTIFVLIK